MSYHGRSRLAGGLLWFAVAWSLWAASLAGAASYRPATEVERRNLSDAVFIGRVAGRTHAAGGGLAIEVVSQNKGRLPPRVILRTSSATNAIVGTTSGCESALVVDSRYRFYVRVRRDGRLTPVGPPEPMADSATASEWPRATSRVDADATSSVVASWEETEILPDTDRPVAAREPSAPARSVIGGLSGVSIPVNADPFPSRLVTGDASQRIPYRVDAAAWPAGPSLEEVLETVARAFDVWEGATGLRFQLDAVEDFGLAADQTRSDDGVIRIQLHDLHNRIDDPLTLAFGGLFAASGPLGFGHGGRVWDQEFHRTTGGYVIVNHRQSLLSNAATLEEVLAHEIGHTLGLAHSSDLPDEEDSERAEALMFFRVHADGRGAHLTDWDRQAVRSAYPQDSMPPAVFPAVHHAVTVAGGAEARLPELLRIPIHRGPRNSTSEPAWTIRLFPAATSAIYGEFIAVDGDIAYHPLGFFEKAALASSSASFYDRAVYRIETGTHASAVESVRVLSLGRDGLHEDPDGLPDSWVERWFGPGSVIDPEGDSDGDGCSEKVEFQQGTDPGDPDSCVTIAFAPAPMTVGEFDAGFELELRCSEPTVRPVAVEWIWKGSATFGEDYLVPDGYAQGAVLPPGVTRWAVPVSLRADDVSEGEELLEIEITAVEGAGRSATQSVAVTIEDDEELPVYRFEKAAYEAREGSIEPLLVTVLRSGRIDLPSCVRVRAHGGEEDSIHPGDDLDGVEWDLCFAEGETAATLVLLVSDDATQEPVETGRLELEVVEGGGVVDSSGSEALLTVDDNDAAPRVAWYVEETREDAPHVEVQARLSHPSRFPVVVSFALRDGSAKASEDYVSRVGTLFISPGELSGVSAIELIDDDWSEDTEEFYLVMTSVENAVAGTGEGLIRLLDDEEKPGLNGPARVDVTEGELLRLSVSLTGPAAIPVAFAWQLVARTVSTQDDVPAEGGMLYFAPGETKRDLELTIPDDAIDEPAESIFLEIAGRVHAQPGPFVAEVVLADNDPRPVLQIEELTIFEHAGVARFPVRLSSPSGFEVSVQITTIGGTAMPGEDYRSASRTLVLPPGAVEGIFEIPLIDDFLTESDETIDLSIGLARNVAVDRTTARVVIMDDDFLGQPGVLTLRAEPAIEGSTATIELSRLPLSAVPTVVRYRTVAETAQAPDDYAEMVGEAVIAPGETSVFVEIPVVSDGLDEEDETFRLEIVDSGGLTLSDEPLQLTIVDIDDPPELSLEVGPAAEGEPIEMLLKLSEPSGRRITGRIDVAGGTAMGGEDYIVEDTSFVIAPGETETAIGITVFDDARAEETETVFLILTDLVGAMHPGLSFAVEISDNEDLPFEGRLELEMIGQVGELRWQGREGLRYRIQISRDLREWQEVLPSSVLATGLRELLSLPNEIARNPEVFLRLVREEAEEAALEVRAPP